MTIFRFSGQCLWNFCRHLQGQVLSGRQLHSQIHTPWSLQTIGRICNPMLMKVSSTVKVYHYSNSSSFIQIDETDEPDTLYKKIVLKLKGHDTGVLESYQQFVTMAAAELDITVANVQDLPKHFNRFTLLKSRHIYKKHRVQYEIRTHFKEIELKHLTGSTADTYLEYIERNIPEGIAMQVQKFKVEQLPSHIKPPSPSDEEKE
ncbi:small ribosomal subunit protein uS10m-like [Glandiceps talaboti]